MDLSSMGQAQGSSGGVARHNELGREAFEIQQADYAGNLVYARHGHRGEPIEVVVLNRDENWCHIAHVTPKQALDLARTLLEFYARETFHP